MLLEADYSRRGALTIAPGLGPPGAKNLVQDVVRKEHLSLLRKLALRTRCHRGSAGPVMSAAERRRLEQVALTLLARAASRSKADCDRILGAAELEAAKIRRENNGDRLSNGSVPKWHDPPPVVPPKPPSPTSRPQPALVEALPPDSWDERDSLEAAFFASFAHDESDRWRFLDDGDPDGVGPAFVRRLLRRPVRSREKVVQS